MAISENSVKILDYLKANHGKNLTSGDVADALDLTKSQVDGAFTSFQRKGIGTRVDGEEKGAVEVSFLTITAEGKAADATEMSDNAKAILAYLTEVDGQNITLDDMADATGIEKRKVNGSFNALVKKGLCARTTAKVEAMVPVKYLVLTEEGLAYTPADAE